MAKNKGIIIVRDDTLEHEGNWIQCDEATPVDDANYGAAYWHPAPEPGPWEVGTIVEFNVDDPGTGSPWVASNGEAITIPWGNDKCTVFDGINEYCNTDPFPTNWTDFSFSCWVKTSGGGNRTVVYLNNGNDTEFAFIKILSNNKVNVVIWDNGSYANISSNTGITPNTWTLITAVRESGTVKMYVNGTIQTATGSSSGTFTLNSILHVGSDRVPVQFLGGDIDEVAIWNVALDAGQVAALRSSDPTPVPVDLEVHSASGNLIHWYRMGDIDTYPTVVDYAGTNNLIMNNMSAGNFVDF